MNKTKLFNICYTMSAILMLMPGISTACLTSLQNQTLLEMVGNNVTKFNAMYSLFDTICSNIDSVNQSIPNMTLYYNKTTIDDKFNDTNAKFGGYYNKSESDSRYINSGKLDILVNTTELEKLEARINTNMTKYVTADEMQVWNDTFDEKLAGTEQRLTDIFDSKIMKMRKDYATKEDITNATMEMWSVIRSIPNPIDTYNMYIFYLTVAGLVVFTVLYVWKPQMFKAGGIIKDIKTTKMRVEDVTTESELKKRIEMMRKLKLKIAKLKKPKLTKEQKLQLMQMVNDRVIESEDDLKKEVEILARI